MDDIQKHNIRIHVKHFGSIVEIGNVRLLLQFQKQIELEKH
jgi:hypothetical protein